MIELGPFLLERPIGRGAMGEVWRGAHATEGTAVAIKVLTASVARDERFRAFFRNEVRFVAGLDHPHVVQVYDYGDIPWSATRASGGGLVNESPYLVMEWASGGTLKNHPPVTWDETLQVLVRLLDALAHAHARGVIHRDIKPVNVLVCTAQDHRPGLKLADFGIAGREMDTDISYGGGTPAYMSPEQIRGTWRDQGPWTDLYAVGCLAYRMVSGAPPFRARDAREVARLHLSSVAPPLRPLFAVPAKLENWIRRLMEKAPKRRFQRAADATWALLRLGPATIAPPLDAPTAALREAKTLVSPLPGSPPHLTDASLATVATLAQLVTADARTLMALPGADTDRDASQREPATPTESIGSPSPLDDIPPMAMLPQETRRNEERLSGVGLGLYGLRPVPLIDREPERCSLWDALHEVRATGQARAIVLQGASGCGKSRLAEWLCERAHELGAAEVLRVAHGPIRGVMDGLEGAVVRWLRLADLSGTQRLNRLIYAMSSLGIPDPTAEATPLAGWLGNAFEGHARSDGTVLATRERNARLRRVLGRYASRRPLVLWIDDAQWGADALGLVEHILAAQATEPTPILCLLTVREEAMAEQLQAQTHLRSILGDEVSEVCNVGPLGLEHRGELVQQLLALEQELSQRVEEHTAGNPLFAIQLVGDWVQRRELEAGPDGFRLRSGQAPVLPDDLGQVWGARIDRILEGHSRSARDALEIAAILGQQVDAMEWADACAAAEIPVPHDVVEALLGASLARCDLDGPGVRWSYVHGMLRETLEERARTGNRLPRHHAAIAVAVAARPGDPRSAERLGRHLVAAGEPSRAIEPLLEGAKYRNRCADFPLAAALLDERDEAMRACGVSIEDPRWGAGVVQRAYLLRSTARFQEAEEVGRQVLEAVGRLGDDEAGWSRVEAEALMELGSVARMQGEFDRALELFARAEELARVLSDSRLAAQVLQKQGWVQLERGDFAASEAAMLKAMAALDEMDEPVLAAGSAQALYIAAQQTGRLEDARGYLERALAYLERSGASTFLANCLNNLGDLKRLGGDLEEAERLYREALAQYRVCGAGQAMIAEINIGLVLLDRERYAEARDVLKAVADNVVRTGRRAIAGIVHACLTACSAGAGDWTGFDIHLTEARAAQQETGFVDGDAALTFQRAGQIAFAAGEMARARPALELAHAMWTALGRDTERETVQALLARTEPTSTGGDNTSG